MTRVTCAMCGHQVPVGANGRGFVECSCGMRIETGGATATATAAVIWAVALLVVAVAVLFWLSR